MEVRDTGSVPEKLDLLATLVQRDPRLGEDESFTRSLLAFARSEAYRCVSATEGEELLAAGLFTIRREVMSERPVVSAEAFWFASEDAELQRAVWVLLARKAEAMDLHGVSIPLASTNDRASLTAMAERQVLGSWPVGVADVAFRCEEPDIYTPYDLYGRVLTARSVRISTLKIEVDVSGVASRDEPFFYRGEGRLSNLPAWEVASPRELADHLLGIGFPARGKGLYGGTIVEQILQQGYVNQPTVSLTDAFDVAAYYATKGHSRGPAVVFTIDGNVLRGSGDVFDSFATMTKHCEWIFFESDLEQIPAIVERLGVLHAGRLLQRSCDEAERFVRLHDGLEMARDGIAWIEALPDGTLRELRAAGISREDLERLNNSFEVFWMHALGRIGSVDELRPAADGEAPSVVTRPTEPFAYFGAFHQARGRLQKALDAGGEHRSVGWDLTPFGYVAKTCRDKEFFSTGSVPSEAVVRATEVDRAGRPREVIAER